jgi:lipopolysaccharide biosynthesis glycosyltransferase
MIYAVNMLAKPKQVTTSQTGTANISDAMLIYLKNSFVSLYSIKKNNPEILPILCSDLDIKQEYPDLYNQFIEKNIQIINVAFGNLDIVSQSDWSICNYRYDVMKYLINNLNSEDIVIMLDTDVICVSSLADLFEDLESDLFLYDVNHRRNNKDRKKIIDNYYRIYGKYSNLIHYGGEFICGKISVIQELYNACIKVIEESNSFNDLINFNDEHITSIAVANFLKDKVHNSECYIYRYWTDKFYLASTNYLFNAVSLWHLPAEKNLGMLWMYNYIIKHNKLPNIQIMARMCRFPKPKKAIYLRIIRRIKRILHIKIY